MFIVSKTMDFAITVEVGDAHELGMPSGAGRGSGQRVMMPPGPPPVAVVGITLGEAEDGRRYDRGGGAARWACCSCFVVTRVAYTAMLSWAGS